MPKTFSESPVVRLVVPILLGGYVGWYSRNGAVDVAILAFVGILVFMGALFFHFLYHAFRTWYFSLCLIFFSFFIGLLLMTQRITDSTYSSPGKCCAILVVDRIVTKPLRPIAIDAHFVQVRQSSNQWQSFKGKTKIWTKSVDEVCRNGDTIVVKATFDSPINRTPPFIFDYVSYLHKNGIYATAFLQPEEIAVLGNASPYSVISFSSNVNKRLSAIVDSSILLPKHRAIVSALLWGDKSDLDVDLIDDFKTAGLMHILAVSGLHAGIIYMILNFIFGCLKHRKIGRFVFVIISLVILWSYAIVTGLAPSVTRAVLMFSILIIGESIDKRGVSLNSVGVAAIVLFMVDPLLIMGLSFQLSFAAVTAIVMAIPLLRFIHTSHFFLNLFLQITFISVVATLGTLPITLYHFGQFPTWFILSNVVVLPVIPVLMYLSISAVLLELFLPGMTMIWIMLDKLLSLFVSFVTWESDLPFALLSGIELHWLAAICLSLALIFFVTWLLYMNRKLLFFFFAALIITLGVNEVWFSLKKERSELGILLHRNQPSLILESANAVHLISDTDDFRPTLESYCETKGVKFNDVSLVDNVIIVINGRKVMYVSDISYISLKPKLLADIDLLVVKEVLGLPIKHNLFATFSGQLVIGEIINQEVRDSFFEQLNRQEIDYHLLHKDGAYLSSIF